MYIRMILWSKNEHSSDSFGSVNASIGDIESSMEQEFEFFDSLTKKAVKHRSRQYSGKKFLISPFSNSQGRPILNYKLWFQQDLPEELKLSAFKVSSTDNYPQVLGPYLQNNDKSFLFVEWVKAVKKLRDHIDPADPIRIKNMLGVFKRDQYKKFHLIPLYLSKISPPDFMIDQDIPVAE